MWSFLKYKWFLLTLSIAGGMATAMQGIPPEMITLFPIGRVFEGVKLPSYKEDVLQSIMEADSVERVNQLYLNMTNLKIRTFSPDGQVSSTTSMDKARIQYLQKQMESTTPARIDHEKFVMTGDRLTYDFTKEFSTMEGNVKVVIPDAGDFTNGLSSLGE